MNYYECSSCEALFLDPTILAEIDAGRSLVDYSGSYWENELAASRDRSWGPAVARVAEVFLYAKRPIDVFLDIGAGAGFLLDSLSTYLPASAAKFYGIEKYPPQGRSSNNPNLFIRSLRDFGKSVDAGCCIEVIEHLTPKMLSEMLGELAAIAAEDAIFIINSGQPAFVKNEDPGYLDPFGRGHLVSYSAQALDILAGPFGFRVHCLPGKTWALLLEKTASRAPENVANRIWAPHPANVAALRDPAMGSVMYILGIDTARAYG